jgi:hypothetical protein
VRELSLLFFTVQGFLSIFFAALSRADLDRGFDLFSFSSANMGFFVSISSFGRILQVQTGKYGGQMQPLFCC